MSSMTLRLGVAFVLLSTVLACGAPPAAGPAAPGAGPAPEGVACTQEAKMCPDGSAVARTGPNCEFAPCPAPTTP